jgi:hypothetical protein
MTNGVGHTLALDNLGIHNFQIRGDAVVCGEIPDSATRGLIAAGKQEQTITCDVRIQFLD